MGDFFIRMPKNGSYQLVDQENGRVTNLRKIVKCRSKAYERAYILEFENGKKRYAFFEQVTPGDEFKARVSPEFDTIIEEFTDALVVELNDERYLIKHHTDMMRGWEWPRGYEVKTLTNGREVVLRNDFEISPDFDSLVHHYTHNDETGKETAVITLGESKGECYVCYVMRINDFKVFETRLAMYSGQNEEYMKVVLKNGKQAVLRTRDFKVSKQYDYVELWNNRGYAFVYNKGEEARVFWLSKFRVLT